MTKKAAVGVQVNSWEPRGLTMQVPNERKYVISGAIFCLVVFSVLVLLIYLTMQHGHTSEGPSNLVGRSAPDFTLKDINGKPVSLASLRGKPVILNFWATWCSPCKEETPWLVDLQEQYKTAGLQVLGVALDDSSETAVADFARKQRISYPIMIGNESIARLYGGVRSLPTTFYIARDGTVVNSVLGVIDKEQIEQNIRKVLKR